jgi:hypothetical protein
MLIEWAAVIVYFFSPAGLFAAPSQKSPAPPPATSSQFKIQFDIGASVGVLREYKAAERRLPSTTYYELVNTRRWVADMAAKEDHSPAELEKLKGRLQQLEQRFALEEKNAYEAWLREQQKPYSGTDSPGHDRGDFDIRSETSWNAVANDQLSGLVYADGSPAAGVTFDVGTSPDNGPINWNGVPRLGGADSTGGILATPLGKTNFWLPEGNIGLRVKGLPAGTYRVYALGRSVLPEVTAGGRIPLSASRVYALGQSILPDQAPRNYRVRIGVNLSNVVNPPQPTQDISYSGAWTEGETYTTNVVTTTRTTDSITIVVHGDSGNIAMIEGLQIAKIDPSKIDAKPARKAIPAFTDGFKLVPGDHVVFIGDTATKVDRRHSYLETMLSSRYPGRQIVFRNLGWEGDTVFRQDRPLNFGGWPKHLKEQGATVIFVSFGMIESLRGASALPAFVKAYDRLLDVLSQNTARIVLVSPVCSEAFADAVQDPATRNQNLRVYTKAIRDIAARRGYVFVNLFEALGEAVKEDPALTLTHNGIHPSAYGYWRASAAIERNLGLGPPKWRVEIKGSESKATGTQVTEFQRSVAGISFRLNDETLPGCRFYPESTGGKPLVTGQRILVVDGLAPGKYALRIDGGEVAQGSHAEWAKGVALTSGPEFEQVEKLREIVVLKNTDFFNYWRPENWEFLYGSLTDMPSSRLHTAYDVRWFPEEIKQFLPLIAQKESVIGELAVPKAHRYDLALIK